MNRTSHSVNIEAGKMQWGQLVKNYSIDSSKAHKSLKVVK